MNIDWKRGVLALLALAAIAAGARGAEAQSKPAAAASGGGLQAVLADDERVIAELSRLELVTLRVEAEGNVPALARPELARGDGAEPVGRQIVHDVSGPVEALVFDRTSLGAGDCIAGPAIVTQLDATTLVAAGWRAEVLASGALMLRRG